MFQQWRSQDAAKLASAILVILVSGLAGQFAAQGMNAVQWLGAVLAVLGSVTLPSTARIAPSHWMAFMPWAANWPARPLTRMTRMAEASLAMSCDRSRWNMPPPARSEGGK